MSIGFEQKQGLNPTRTGVAGGRALFSLNFLGPRDKFYAKYYGRGEDDLWEEIICFLLICLSFQYIRAVFSSLTLY